MLFEGRLIFKWFLFDIYGSKLFCKNFEEVILLESPFQSICHSFLSRFLKWQSFGFHSLWHPITNVLMKHSILQQSLVYTECRWSPFIPNYFLYNFPFAYLSNKVLDLTLKLPRNEDSNFYAILLYSPTYPLGQTRDQPQQASGMYATG